MAKQEAPAEAKEGKKAKKKGGKKKKLIMLLLVLLIAGGGGYTMLGKKAKAAPADGPVMSLDPVTLNLADGHYLQVALALQLAPMPKKAPKPDSSKVLDTTILYLGDHTYNQLVAPGGRLQAKEGLVARLGKLFPGKVKDVYFTQFVMQ
jgi:flagellar FliL protein